MAVVFITLVVGIVPTTAVVIGARESRSESRNKVTIHERLRIPRIVVLQPSCTGEYEGLNLFSSAAYVVTVKSNPWSHESRSDGLRFNRFHVPFRLFVSVRHFKKTTRIRNANNDGLSVRAGSASS